MELSFGRVAGLIERIKNSDRDGGMERERRILPEGSRRVLESGLTFGRGRRKRNQLVVRFRNTDLLARVPLLVYHYRKTLDDPFFFSFHRREPANAREPLFALRSSFAKLGTNIVPTCASRAVRTYTRHLEEIAIFVGR